MAAHQFKVYHIGLHARDALATEVAEIERMGAKHIIIEERLTTEDDLIARARDADALVIVDSPVRKKAFDNLPNLKAVLRTGVGYDTIDVPSATEHGIVVINVPDLWIREVANHALGILLALNRKILLLDRSIRAGLWHPIIPPPVGSLHGETIGIIGLGKIGSAFATRVHALDMKIIATDPYIPMSRFKEFNAEPVSLDGLLERSDYVSMHCPRTAETTHLINETTLRKMKPTAFLINTARGPIVDQKVLVKALEEKWIAGAGLDVQEYEKPWPDNPLCKMDNVVLTPHVGYYSTPALAQLPTRSGQELVRVLQGFKPLNPVNPEVFAKLSLKDK